MVIIIRNGINDPGSNPGWGLKFNIIKTESKIKIIYN